MSHTVRCVTCDFPLTWLPWSEDNRKLPFLYRCGKVLPVSWFRLTIPSESLCWIRVLGIWTNFKESASSQKWIPDGMIKSEALKSRSTWPDSVPSYQSPWPCGVPIVSRDKIAEGKSNQLTQSILPTRRQINRVWETQETIRGKLVENRNVYHVYHLIFEAHTWSIWLFSDRDVWNVLNW